MRTGVLSAVLLTAGCGSYWDIREGEVLDIGCAGRLNYYDDVDGDGWGQVGSEPTALCEPDPQAGLTASNALDCDDTDPDVTGKIGLVCPADLDPAGTPCYSGLVFGDSEFVVTCGESQPQRFTAAQQLCDSWSTDAAQDDTSVQRGLATLEAGFERVEVLEAWLESLEEVEAGFSIFVDLRWSGSLETGTWAWPSGAPPDGISPCGGVEPTVADFYPDLVPSDPNAAQTLEEHKGEVRSVLVFDGVGWCRGTPSDGGAGYDHQSAHYLCERPRPDLSQHEEQPSAAETQR